VVSPILRLDSSTSESRQAIVANKNLLFYRQGEPFQQQAIRDTLPILLGVSSSQRYELEAKLKAAQRDLRIASKQLESARETRDSIEVRGTDTWGSMKALKTAVGVGITWPMPNPIGTL
jgi:outer membrane PBP1 activator LpoA protein